MTERLETAQARYRLFRRGASKGRAIWLRADGTGVHGPLHPDLLDATFLAEVTHDKRYGFVTAQREGSSWDISGTTRTPDR